MRTAHPKTDPLPHLILLACALLASTACVYTMPIQQGNFLDKTQVDQLQPGMTRSQVSFLLGTPMVPNGFDADRWDYYYYAKYSRKYAADSYRVTVYFKDEKVDHVDKPKVPEPPPGAPAATPAPETTPAPEAPPATQAPAKTE
jgi:outer membrane protein assembly factor BamE